jgi:hypothetical protein
MRMTIWINRPPGSCWLLESVYADVIWEKVRLLPVSEL